MRFAKTKMDLIARTLHISVAPVVSEPELAADVAEEQLVAQAEVAAANWAAAASVWDDDDE